MRRPMSPVSTPAPTSSTIPATSLPGVMGRRSRPAALPAPADHRVQQVDAGRLDPDPHLTVGGVRVGHLVEPELFRTAEGGLPDRQHRGQPSVPETRPCLSSHATSDAAMASGWSSGV